MMARRNRELPGEPGEGVEGFVDPENRTTRQEIEALGVPIEPLRQEEEGELLLIGVEWLEKTNRGGSKKALGSQISLTKHAIRLGVIAAVKLARDAEEEIKTLRFGAAIYQGQRVLLVRVNDSKGFDVKQSECGSLSIATKSVVQRLISKGLPVGRYRLVNKVQDIWIAAPAEEVVPVEEEESVNR